MENKLIMRRRLYNFLVNRLPGIKQRYHQFHDGSTGLIKVLSWIYLILLNIGYYLLFLRFLGKEKVIEYYEQKKIPINESESELNVHTNNDMSVVSFVDQLKEYDVISFDVFDTLIFRPFAQPTDIFYLVGEKLGMLDFRRIRMWAEWRAREKHHENEGHYEVTFAEIWDKLSYETGIDPEYGMRLEWETELSLCYANPFMLEVWNRLLESGKKLIIVSDMYLSRQHISELLTKNGFIGADSIYVSCEYSKSKANGELFEVVRSDYPTNIIHVGDNPISDVRKAKRAGFDVLHYPNINRNEQLYRPYDMSYIIGSAYRALVNSRIYNGQHVYSMEYEYGYIYGGLFVLGYISFIHKYYVQEGLDKLLFLSRDGDILLKVYRMLYPDDNADYAYISRKAVTKLMFGIDRYDYFRRFIYHKINQNYSIREILKSMELESFIEDYGTSHNLEEELTDRNADILKKYINDNRDKVEAAYFSQLRAAGFYYTNLLEGCNKVAAVDIGWAGSGPMALYRLVSTVWNIPCDVRGIIAGTNTLHNIEPDASEPFLQSGRLVSYLYSQSHNRDILKRHDPDKGYNVFWELLLASDTPQFKGFYEGDVRKGDDDIYIPDIGITLGFGRRDVDPKGAQDIQKGILDYASDYVSHFDQYPCMFNISGRDAYAPILCASGNNEQYLKSMEKRFELEVNVV
jgi:HAD superfamily hydrolase (TIGR01549 family)